MFFTFKDKLPNILHSGFGDKCKCDLRAIQEHLLCCNYSPCFEDFSILTTESNGFKLKIMESLLNGYHKPLLTKAVTPIPLELF